MNDIENLRNKIRAAGLSPPSHLIETYSDALVSGFIGGSLQASANDILECLRWIEPHVNKAGRFLTNAYNIVMYLTKNSSDFHFKINLTIRLLAILPADFPQNHVQTLEYNAGVFYESIHETYHALYHLNRSVAMAASYKLIEPQQYARDTAASLCQIGLLYLNNLQNIDEAIRILNQALLLEPSNIILCNSFVIIYNKIGKPETALEMSNRALELLRCDTNQNSELHSALYLNIASTYTNLNRISDSMNALEKSLSFKLFNNDLAYTQWLFLRQHSPLFAGTPGLMQDYTGFNRVFAPILTTHYSNPDPLYVPFAKRLNSPLRIGLVCSDFVDHAVGDFIHIILTRVASRSDVTIFAYNNNSRNIAERFPSVQWRHIHNMLTQDAVQLIKNDHIDILFDLNAHTNGNRLDIFACKAAANQITYAGYAATTGLASMDACLTDTKCHPSPELGAQQYSEELLFMPRSLLCYTPRSVLPALEPPPATKMPYFTFGSYHKLIKLNDRVIEVYAKILQAVPTARLVFKSMDFTIPSLIEQTRQRFDATTRDRLVFLPTSKTYEEHLLMFNHCDIALDAWPYSGTTTTCEALSMGVPMLTLRDEITWVNCQNMSSMILLHSGIDEFVARSEDEFIERAVCFANNKAIPIDRQRIHNAFLNGPVCDYTEFPNEFVKTIIGYASRPGPKK